MFIVSVIPLIKGSQVETLTYYSSQEYQIGSLILVPIRKKEVTALVTEIKPVSAAKTALRAATFSLRKLNVQKNCPVIPIGVIETAKKLTEFYPAKLGAILYTLLPPDIRAGARPYPNLTKERADVDTDITPAVFTGRREDRMIIYRQQIRQNFAHKNSVLFIVPTSAQVSKAKAELENGIEKRVITFASTYSKSHLAKSYKTLQEAKEAVLIVSTPSFAMIAREDVSTIIIDDSGSTFYKSKNRPYLDFRDVLKLFAKITKRSVILGDMVISTEDEVLRRNEIYSTLEEHTQRIQFGSNLIIAAKETETVPQKNFQILLPDTIDTIKRTLTLKGKVFLYAARRGLATAVLCYDCGYLFRCPDSGTPYSLMRTVEGDVERRWFVSSTSGKKIRAADVCPRCNSWRLREQGFGIQQILDEVSKIFPQVPKITFDRTTATTHKKATALAKQFSSTKGIIMIGTHMSLPYLPKSIDVSVVTSYEAARALATWRADETLLSLLYTLQEHTLKECIVQTRSEPDDILKIARRGLIDSFYTDEIEIREALNYPPFCIFILLTIMGTQEQVTSYEAMIDSTITSQPISYYNSPQSHQSKIIRHGLLRISKSNWPDRKLMDELRSLPPFIKVEVNPERIV
ncbi:hypothetical protein KC845_01475 [Candidatus Kaiserbacteria bacterium]|nr:hypothetical protein [Candidatus Kaiserbacteria bacterium]